MRIGQSTFYKLNVTQNVDEINIKIIQTKEQTVQI